MVNILLLFKIYLIKNNTIKSIKRQCPFVILQYITQDLYICIRVCYNKKKEELP